MAVFASKNRTFALMPVEMPAGRHRRLWTAHCSNNDRRISPQRHVDERSKRRCLGTSKKNSELKICNEILLVDQMR